MYDIIEAQEVIMLGTSSIFLIERDLQSLAVVAFTDYVVYVSHTIQERIC